MSPTNTNTNTNRAPHPDATIRRNNNNNQNSEQHYSTREELMWTGWLRSQRRRKRRPMEESQSGGGSSPSGRRQDEQVEQTEGAKQSDKLRNWPAAWPVAPMMPNDDCERVGTLSLLLLLLDGRRAAQANGRKCDVGGGSGMRNDAETPARQPPPRDNDNNDDQDQNDESPELPRESVTTSWRRDSLGDSHRLVKVVATGGDAVCSLSSSETCRNQAAARRVTVTKSSSRDNPASFELARCERENNSVSDNKSNNNNSNDQQLECLQHHESQTTGQQPASAARSETSEIGVKSLANGPLNGGNNNTDCGTLPKLELEQELEGRQQRERKVIGHCCQSDTATVVATTTTTTTMTRMTQHRAGDTWPATTMAAALSEPTTSDEHEQRSPSSSQTLPSFSSPPPPPRRTSLQLLPVPEFAFQDSSFKAVLAANEHELTDAPNREASCKFIEQDQDRKREEKQDKISCQLLEDATRVGPHPAPDYASRCCCGCRRHLCQDKLSPGDEPARESVMIWGAKEGSLATTSCRQMSSSNSEVIIRNRRRARSGSRSRSRGLRVASLKWCSSRGKMQPLNGRQLLVWGSLMLILLSLLASINWSSLIFASNHQQLDACSSVSANLKLCGRSGPARLTIAASAANTNTDNNRQQQQQQQQQQHKSHPKQPKINLMPNMDEYEMGASTTRMPPPLSSSTASTTTMSSTASATTTTQEPQQSYTTTGAPQLLVGKPSSSMGPVADQQQQMIMTTEQTTATLSAPTTAPRSDSPTSSQSHHREPEPVLASTTTAPQQQPQSSSLPPLKASLQKAKKASAKLASQQKHKIIIGKLRPPSSMADESRGSQGGGEPREVDTRIDSVGWRAIESSSPFGEASPSDRYQVGSNGHVQFSGGNKQEQSHASLSWRHQPEIVIGQHRKPEPLVGVNNSDQKNYEQQQLRNGPTSVGVTAVEDRLDQNNNNNKRSQVPSNQRIQEASSISPMQSQNQAQLAQNGVVGPSSTAREAQQNGQTTAAGSANSSSLTSGWSIDSADFKQLLAGLDQTTHGSTAAGANSKGLSSRDENKQHRASEGASAGSASPLQTSSSQTAPAQQPAKISGSTTAAARERQLLESALIEALDDLATSAADEPAAKIKRPPPGAHSQAQHQHSSSLPQANLVTDSQFQQTGGPPMMSMFDWRHFQRQQAGSAQLPAASSSQSAPSVSLPPISHFLSPRNPFRLFASASASTPVASRYWPIFGMGHQQQQHSSNQQPARHSNRWFSSGNEQGNQHHHQKLEPHRLAPMQTSAHDEPVSLELESIASQLHNQVMAPMSLSETLFAHSQSAEQLEKLVRAASQAGHLPRGSPPILPAIVSGPGGQTFPGFYIPAIDQDSPSQASSSMPNQPRHEPHESTASSFNHMHQLGSGGGASSPYLAQDSMSLASSNGYHSGASGSSGTAGLYSTIPGTDYVLHPDEVRAMIQIGESAWQKQQQQHGHQTSASSTHQVASGGSGNLRHHHQQHHSPSAYSFGRLWQGPSEAQNLMQENHLENLRNYAYIENMNDGSGGGSSSYSNEHLQGASSATSERQLSGRGGGGPNGTRPDSNQAQLGVQLNRALMRARSKALPAIIRVNDQDYVHWPLIQVPGGEQQHHQQRPMSHQQHQEFQKTAASTMSAEPVSSSAPSVHRNHHNQQQQQQAFDRSPLRLSTQLTPHEIRQVEHSILETLIMAQTLQHQQKMMDAIQAAASSTGANHQQQGNRHQGGKSKWLFKPTMGGLNKPFGSSGAAGAGSGRFFTRRKRRRRNSAASATKQRQQMPPLSLPPSLAGAPSSPRQHFMSILPLINAANPVGLYSSPSQASFASLAAGLASQQQQQPQVVDNSMLANGGGGSDTGTINDLQQAGGESKLSKRLPTVMADQETNKANTGSTILATTDTLSTEASGPTGAAMRSFLRGDAGAGAKLTRVNSHNQTTNAVLATTAPPTQQAQEPGHQHQSLAETTFGSRVRPGAGTHTATELGRLNKTSNQDHDYRLDQSKRTNEPSTSSAKLHNQYVTFVPIQNNRNKQISLYTNGFSHNQDSGSTGYSTASGLASTDDAGRHQHQADQRFNPVDWPAMVSDADYFPAGQSSERQAQNHERLAKLSGSHKNDNDNRQGDPVDKLSSLGGTDSTSASAGNLLIAQSRPPRTMAASQEDRGANNNKDDNETNDDDDDGSDEDEDDKEHEPVGEGKRASKIKKQARQQEPTAPRQPKQTAATIQVIQAPSTRRGNFVTSQTKLQFAPDYQAREGVPIYNNNVRVAGAMDRQRSLIALANG